MKITLFWLLGICLIAVEAKALESRARCTAEYGGKTVNLEIQPTADVYTVTTSDALAPFRVSAQYLSDRGKLKTYAYHDAKDRYVLIHAAEYQLNNANCSQHASGFGLNRIYSARLEKELQFQCFAVCRD